MEINYLAEIIAFERWLETDYLPIPSQLLWYKMMNYFNRSGWSEWVTVDNLRLMAAMSMSREATFIKARDELIKAGRIIYQKGRKGSPNKYKMVYFTFKNVVKSEVYSEVKSEVFPVVESEVQSADIYKHKQKQNKKKDTNVSKEPTDPSKVKHKHGEYGHVLLTEQELEKLNGEYGASLVTDAVRYLDEYVEMKGYKHKSSYLAIRKWVIDAVKRERKEKGGCFRENDKPDKSREAGNYLEDAGEDFTGF